MKTISGQTYEEERALYHLTDAAVLDCRFAGAADGESPLKEAARVTVRDCRFALRYPLWHASDFSVENTAFEPTSRAPLWYAKNGLLRDVTVEGVKCLRECENMTLEHVTAVSAEFGWRCRGLKMRDCDLTSEYALMASRDADLRELRFFGKYSFQYTENLTIENSVLDTKDAFWHARNVTVRNCRITGEYIGWYSEGLTFEDCYIAGTQPFCYCDRLVLRNCEMENADLAFEYADVQADVKGEILSVKNPKSGEIRAERIGELILSDSVMPLACRVYADGIALNG